MSNHHLTPVANPIHAKPLEITLPLDVHVEVAGLIAAAKCKQAVERAKEHHKRANTPESQKLLVDAYVSRIGQFQEKGQVEDARMLISLVKERFPVHVDRLGMLETRTAASGGLVDELVSPLARAEISESLRENIETAIRQQLLDLHGLAGCKSLPASHPLRTAAAAVWRAFEAATAGPVTDDQIALPEVSRRSPLAGWRMLIRAIAGLHRHDDEGCRRALEAIPPDAAVARLAPVVLDMLQASPPGRGAVGVLQARIGNSDDLLREAFDSVERGFRGRYLDDLLPPISKALRACETSRPELCETLRRRLMVRCVAAEVPTADVHKVLGTTMPDASFWRLLARAFEQNGAGISGVLAWERFICHAVNEKMITPDSMEAGMVYGHMASVLAEKSPKSIEKFKRENARTDGHSPFYKYQPPHIAALAPKNPRELMERTVSPDNLFWKAAPILRDGETYRAWLAWAQRVDLPVKHQEDICLNWKLALPRDPNPPLQLSRMAEERNALSMALKRLAEAEAIDPFNPAVRKARSRLTIATFWRHMKDRKAHLAAKDLAELESLDAFKDGDRGAFLWAAKAACHTLEINAEAATQASEKVYEKMGRLAGGVLLMSVGVQSKLPGLIGLGVDEPEPVATAQAHARLSILSREIALPMYRPKAWIPLIRKVLMQNPCPLSIPEILSIGRTYMVLNEKEPAYIASAVGLQKAGGADVARFLLLRARSLGRFFPERTMQCLRAAKELARQVHDAELMSDVSDTIADSELMCDSISDGKPLDPSVLAQILAAERGATRFPNHYQTDKAIVYIEQEGRFGGGFSGLDEFCNPIDQDDDDEPADLGSALPGIPPQLLATLAKLMKQYGKVPSPAQLQQDHPELVAELSRFLGPMF